jgi:Transposase DNA-binding/Transposase DDE domain
VYEVIRAILENSAGGNKSYLKGEGLRHDALAVTHISKPPCNIQGGFSNHATSSMSTLTWVPSFSTNPVQWAEAQWGSAELGDRRRTRRAVRLGASIAAQSAASLPKQTQSWSDLKAAYRLLNKGDVTHEQLSMPHWQATRRHAEGMPGAVVLFVQDTSELDFLTHWALRGTGHLNDIGRGFLMHSCLAISPQIPNPEMLGLAYQTVWTRDVFRRRTETKITRQKRRSEADIWAETVEAIGPAPDDVTWISVGDRASDVFSYVRRTRTLGWHCLLRVNQERRIMTQARTHDYLKRHVRSLPAQATKTVTVRGREGKPNRQLILQVAWTSLTLQPPGNRPEKYELPQPGWCVRCWNDDEDVEWILFSTVPVEDADAALVCISWYEHRWLIEEYHKCLKTGCVIEKRQLTTSGGMLALLGFLALTAVRLLQLRGLARTDPEGRAQSAGIEPLFLRLIAARLRQDPSTVTIAAFWRGVAVPGGFIGRTGDGEPSWQTLWDGWRRLQDMEWGAHWMETQLEKCG